MARAEARALRVAGERHVLLVLPAGLLLWWLGFLAVAGGGRRLATCRERRRFLCFTIARRFVFGFQSWGVKEEPREGKCGLPPAAIFF